MEKLIQIYDQNVVLEGMLRIPKGANGIVLFAHGSGSGRFSPRNNFVGSVLNKAGLATLLIDLLSEEEDEIYQTRFNIDLLTKRLELIVNWLKKETGLPIGLFGASTGAAAALETAAAMPKEIRAVVSRGGRPDLAMKVLSQVKAPTLLIVGGNDFGVIELNQQAYDQLLCEKSWEIVPNATHLFEEPGCLETVAELAKNWFISWIAPT